MPDGIMEGQPNEQNRLMTFIARCRETQRLRVMKTCRNTQIF